MFYINHNTDNFTVIDCCLYWKEGVKEKIIDEIKQKKAGKGITRFISTHPDDDHISGLEDYYNEVGIYNFYVVKNEATREGDNPDFNKYCELRDSEKAFYLHKGCSRKWMNVKDDVRKSSGLHCLWPIITNDKYIEALKNAKEGKDPNNISPVIQYLSEGFSFVWLGDMLSDMLEEFDKHLEVTPTTVLFAPHHGRKSGRISKSLLDKLTPKLIIIGEAPSEDIEYYGDHNTITQNTAKDIRFDIVGDFINIYVSNSKYTTEAGLINNNQAERISESMYYLGSIAK
jgi:beta-lactamase superfamily II metal-dependent hydrolase